MIIVYILNFSDIMMNCPVTSDLSEKNDGSPMKRSVALFLMKTKNECRLTQSAMNDITHATGELCQVVVRRMKRSMTEMVEEDSHMDHDNKRALLDKVNDIEINLFQGLNSEHLQEKYYREKFGYMVSL